ncbi:MAG: alpha-2-macroglobulin family protein, partial [Patescibacteria group bacterium]
KKTTLHLINEETEYGKQQIDISSDHIFSGEFVLPDVRSDYYRLELREGDKKILTHTIQVQEYRKPIYTMQLEMPEKAVIFGEKAQFNVEVSYFDGTPVVGKKVHVNEQSYVLDAFGKVSGSLIASTDYGYLNVGASLTEPGFERVSSSNYLKMYPSVIHVQGEAKIKDKIATVSLDSRTVVITNSDDRSDDVKTIRPNTSVNLAVIESFYEKIETGTSYDFISKTVRKNYRYDYHKNTIQNQTLTTDQQGHASMTFSVPNPNAYYEVQLTTIDDKLRKATQTLSVLRDFERGFGDGSGESSLEFRSQKMTDQYGNSDNSFSIGEEVQLEVQRNNRRFEADEHGSFLFLQAQRGIQEYQITNIPRYNFSFQERDIPNIYVYGTYFSGSGYSVISSYYRYGAMIQFDTTSRKLDIQIQTDADSYRPGAEADVKIYVKDSQGKPVSASVNVSVVDEAYFNLFPNTPYPLLSLYSSVSSGIESVLVSHDDTFKIADGRGGGGGDEGSLRSKFVDTGAFVNMITDQNGNGSTKVRLPDNVTSWRFTVQAIDTNKIQAGVNKKNVSTTLPFFIHTAIQPTYLTDDQPEIIVIAQGTAVKQDDIVSYKITVSGTDIAYTTEVSVRDRAHLKLPKLPEGKQSIVIHAQTGNLKDAVSHVVQIVPSRLSIPVVEEKKLADVSEWSGSQTGLTWMTFVDANQGKYYDDLQQLSWRFGDRADEVIVRAVATELLNIVFKEQNAVLDVDASAYQKDDGGIRLLSYADPDPILSAKIALLGEETPFDELKLQAYMLERLYKSDSKHVLTQEEAAWVYAGLAAQKKPIFAELKRFEKQDLSKETQLAVAMAHLYSGNSEGARVLYKALIKEAKRELKYVWVDASTPE